MTSLQGTPCDGPRDISPEPRSLTVPTPPLSFASSPDVQQPLADLEHIKPEFALSQMIPNCGPCEGGTSIIFVINNPQQRPIYAWFDNQLVDTVKIAPTVLVCNSPPAADGPGPILVSLSLDAKICAPTNSDSCAFTYELNDLQDVIKQLDATSERFRRLACLLSSSTQTSRSTAAYGHIAEPSTSPKAQVSELDIFGCHTRHSSITSPPVVQSNCPKLSPLPNIPFLLSGVASTPITDQRIFEVGTDSGVSPINHRQDSKPVSIMIREQSGNLLGLTGDPRVEAPQPLSPIPGSSSSCTLESATVISKVTNAFPHPKQHKLRDAYYKLLQQSPDSIPGDALVQFVGKQSKSLDWSCLFHIEGIPCGEPPKKRLDRAIAHIRKHFGSRPYHCAGECGVEGCTMSFSAMESLKSHVHATRTKTICRRCGKQILKRNLKRHTRKHIIPPDSSCPSAH